jgi:hypothetical protein
VFDYSNVLPGVALVGMVIFSGALWTVLLLRQVAAAFWFTILIPGLISALLLSISDDRSEAFLARSLGIVLALYSVGGFLFARWLFLRAQDVPWSGGNMVMPDLPGLAVLRLGSGLRRQWRPLAALVAKEMQLHRSPFIMAGTLALLHLAVVLLRHFGNFPKNSLTDFVLENFWLLWLGMPLLVGCAAAAEERRLGTLAGQLCLPVRRRTQFIVKAGTVLGLSVFFGAIMPALLELPRVPSEFPFWSAGFKFHGLQAMYLQAGLWPAGQAVLRILVSAPGLAVAIGLISFYASSMSRNALQSLALAILGILGAWSLAIGLLSGSLIAGDPWLGPLIILVGVPALTAILLFLSGRNWKRANMGWQDWLANLVVLLVIVAFFDVVVAARY